MWLNEQVCACKMATGWNAPQGVENVHTLCAGKPESDDRGNNISVKRLGTSLDRCIERYIKNRIIIIITLFLL